MKIDFDKLTKGTLIFSFLLIAFSLFYYLVIFLPQQEQVRLKQQKEIERAKIEQQRWEKGTPEERRRIEMGEYFDIYFER